MRRAAVLSLLLACGGAGAPPSIEKTTFAPSLNVDLDASTKLPQGLYYRDLTVGDGGVASAGQVVTARYTGWLADGTQFDSNQSRGFQFRLGAGEVITGWDLGVEGMRFGGTRQLIIPPSLGYGERGSGPIPGNAILVFDVTLVSSP